MYCRVGYWQSCARIVTRLRTKDSAASWSGSWINLDKQSQASSQSSRDYTGVNKYTFSALQGRRSNFFLFSDLCEAQTNCPATGVIGQPFVISRQKLRVKYSSSGAGRHVAGDMMRNDVTAVRCIHCSHVSRCRAPPLLSKFLCVLCSPAAAAGACAGAGAGWRGSHGVTV